MPKQDPPEEGAPAWMLSLGDMTMLLLCLFVMLVSFMTTEAPGQQRVSEVLEDIQDVQTSMATPTTETQGLIEVQVSEFERRESATSALLSVNDQSYGRMRREEGLREQYTTFTIGADWENFDEGSFELKSTHYTVLDAIKRLRGGSDNIIVVRGFTDTIPYDSLVEVPYVRIDGEWVAEAEYLRENDLEVMPPGPVERANFWVTFAEYMRINNLEPFPADWMDHADFMTLAYRRAQQVADYLALRRAAGEPSIGRHLIRIEVVGPYQVFSDYREEGNRQPRNRRVEVQVTNMGGD